MTLLGILVAVALAGQNGVGQNGVGPNSAGEAAPVKYLTGPDYQRELDQPASGTWSNVELRSVLNSLSAERRTAILLDRRIDPTIKRNLEMNLSLRQGLQQIASVAGAEVSTTENVIYLGPPPAVRRLRTLMEIRGKELATRTIPEKRRAELSKRQTIAWNDLDSPLEILQQIADKYRFKISNLELIPHDLWAGCRLPDVTAAQALSLVLIQFDLTFQWSETGDTLELVAVPEKVTTERRVRGKEKSPNDTLKMLRDFFPELDMRVTGGEILVVGTVEENEAVVDLLTSPGRKRAVPPTPLKQRQFTLTFKRAPVRAVMEELKKSHVVFVYDEAALKAAGVDFDQTVDLELNKASADDFFKGLFTPLKLTFEIDNVTVKLTPAR